MGEAQRIAAPKALWGVRGSGKAFVAAGNGCKEAAALNRTANSPEEETLRLESVLWCGGCEEEETRGLVSPSLEGLWSLASRGALNSPLLDSRAAAAAATTTHQTLPN